jgi:hypothetical protein
VCSAKIIHSEKWQNEKKQVVVVAVKVKKDTEKESMRTPGGQQLESRYFEIQISR